VYIRHVRYQTILIWHFNNQIWHHKHPRSFKLQRVYLKVEWKGKKWIELNRSSVSPYVPALGSEVEKNPASIAASEKNCEHGCAHGDNMAVYGECEVIFREKRLHILPIPPCYHRTSNHVYDFFLKPQLKLDFFSTSEPNAGT
jgi:hypothetical protein